MLKVNKNTEIFEAVSEVDGITVMTFRAEVDKKNPAESSLDVKKESEQLYRQYRDQASADREEFQDSIFAMIDEYENPRSADVPETIDGEYVDVPEAMESIANSWDQLDESEKNRVTEELVGHNHDEEINDTSSEDIPNFTGDDDDQEYHGEWSSIPIPDSTRDEKIRQDCTEEEMTDGTYDCIMAGR